MCIGLLVVIVVFVLCVLLGGCFMIEIGFVVVFWCGVCIVW